MDEIQEGGRNLDLEVEVPDFNNISVDEAREITGDGSITPSTHKHKSTVFLDDDRSIFRTEYSFEKEDAETPQSHVVRFGINGKKAFSRLNPDKLLVDKEGNLIEKSELSKSKYTPNIIQQITHEKLEINLIERATKHLLEQDKKTVLVDIFARHVTDNKMYKCLQNGKIKLIDENTPETHTVILHKVDDNNVFLIDPSSYLFSSHIANKDIQSKLVSSLNINIQVPSQKGYKIYSPFSSDKTGYSEELWRDCIDIAVKLAFLLNTTSYSADDLNKIRTLEEVKFVSNQGLIDDKYFCANNYPIREKQKSDVNIIRDFQDYLKICDDNYRLSVSNLPKDDFIQTNLPKDISNMFLKSLRNKFEDIWKKYCTKKVNDHETYDSHSNDETFKKVYKDLLIQFQDFVETFDKTGVQALGDQEQQEHSGGEI